MHNKITDSKIYNIIDNNIAIRMISGSCFDTIGNYVRDNRIGNNNCNEISGYISHILYEYMYVLNSK